MLPIYFASRYTGYGVFFASVYMIYQTKPLEALDIKYWAKPHAERELQVSVRSIYIIQKKKKNFVGSEALPTSIKARRSPRALAPCVLPTGVIKKGVQ